MKFYGKVFLSMMIVSSVAFGIFGTLMIQASFQSALEREIEIAKVENQMLIITYEAAINSMPGTYYNDKDKLLKYIAKSIVERMAKKENSFKFFDGERQIIFSDNSGEMDEELLGQIDETKNGYRIFYKDGKYLLNVMSMIDTNYGTEVIYLEMTTDISYIYEERNGMFHTYRIIILVMLLVVAMVVLLLSFLLTRSIRQLSKAARNFARGELSVRAEIKSNDEVGGLAEDFNYMADRLTDRMLSLEEQAKRQEDFTSAFAHELKTPLTSIIGYADMIRSMNLTEEERIKAAGYVYSQGKRLEALSLKLLELIVLKKQDFEFVKMDAGYFIQTVFDLAEVGVLEKNLILKRKAEPGKIYGEKDLLISLFANLIDNGKKASKAGSSIWIEGKNIKGGYEITVRDQGRGIPEEELEKITEAFYMVDKSRSRSEGGAGLGMTLCNRIIKLHKADWKIESKVGEGTAVIVSLYEEMAQ